MYNFHNNFFNPIQKAYLWKLTRFAAKENDASSKSIVTAWTQNSYKYVNWRKFTLSHVKVVGRGLI